MRSRDISLQHTHHDKGRMAWLDALRLLAGFSMLVLHCTADSSGGAWAEYEVQERILPLLLRTFAYAARTELFIIISLFLLLLSLERRPRPYVATIGEQAQRLLIPFAFWTLFYAVYNLIKAQQFGYLNQSIDHLFRWDSWVVFLLLGNVKYHMHFLPTLFCVVLCYPLLRKAYERPIIGLFALIICLTVRWELDAFFYPKFWGTPEMAYIARGVKIATHLGYGMVAAAALGLWLRVDRCEKQSWVTPLLVCCVFLFVFKLLATWDTVQAGEWQFDYQPGFWADFIMPAALFVFCMLLGHRHWPEIFSRNAKFAFGVYLCHPIFVDLAEIMLRDTLLSPSWQVILKTGGTAIMATILVKLIAAQSGLAWTIGLGPAPWSIRRNATNSEAL